MCDSGAKLKQVSLDATSAFIWFHVYTYNVLYVISCFRLFALTFTVLLN